MKENLDIYHKIAQFLLNIKARNPREAVCHAFVMDILGVETDTLSVNKVTKGIENKWRIKIPAVRVGDSLKALHNNGFLDKPNSGYRMNEKQKSRYQQSIANRVAFLEEVEQEWIESMQRIGRCRKLTVKEKKLIVEDIRNAVDHMCGKKANGIYNFLCGNANTLESIVISKEITRWLPKKRNRPKEIKDIEKEIFPLFFQIDDVKRAQYIAGLAQTYIRRTIFECELQGKGVLEGRLSSVNIYLDTNLIFDLAGLHGTKREEIARHMVSINHSLGINTLVDERSIREFRAVLNNSRKQHIGSRPPRGIFREVKRAILDPRYEPETEFVLPDDPFVLLFWGSHLDEDMAEKGSRAEILEVWERFLIHFEGIDTIVHTKYGIKIVHNSRNCNPDAQDIEEVNGLMEEAAKRYGISKRPSAIEHDSLMFFMINMLREGEQPECLPSNQWLLSADRSLIYFNRKILEIQKAELSHFVPIVSWTEMTMPFLTIQLVDSEDDALLLAKSLGDRVEQFEVSRVDARQIGEILNRVPETFEKGPEVVLRCATNRHFRETIQKTLGQAKVKKEEVDEAVIQAFDNIKDQVDLSDRKLIEELERKVIAGKELAGSLEEERSIRQELEGELGRTRRIISRIKLGVIGVGLTLLAALTSWVAYSVMKPTFIPFEVDAVFWIVGSLYLIVWVVLLLRKDTIILRGLICSFVPSVLIMMIPLFWIYGGTGYLAIIVPMYLAVVGLFWKLVRESWLDIKIVLNRVGIGRK